MKLVRFYGYDSDCYKSEEDMNAAELRTYKDPNLQHLHDALCEGGGIVGSRTNINEVMEAMSGGQIKMGSKGVWEHVRIKDELINDRL